MSCNVILKSGDCSGQVCGNQLICPNHQHRITKENRARGIILQRIENPTKQTQTDDTGINEQSKSTQTDDGIETFLRELLINKLNGAILITDFIHS